MGTSNVDAPPRERSQAVTSDATQRVQRVPFLIGSGKRF
jgi:hypothetical protein